MSNARSPREVCSITIGIKGLIDAPPGRGSTVSYRRGPSPAPGSIASRARARGRRRLGEWALRLEAGGLDQAVHGGGTEDALDLVLDLLPESALDVGAQLLEGVELARRSREVVVDRRQHLLLQLFDGHLDLCRR